MSELLHPDFDGVKYRLANYWQKFIQINDYNCKAINYLEIGTFYGANLLSVASTYGSHPDSKLYCIDPWIDYNDYPEYKETQEHI